MRVPRFMLTQNDEDAWINAIAGSSGLAYPAADAANHTVGWLMDGLLYTSQTNIARSGTGRLMEYRYPNCEYILFWIHVATIGSGAHSIAMRAGTGAITTVVIPERAPFSFWAVAPWAGGDSGWLEVYWACTDCTIDAISIWSMARDSLTETGGDECIERDDPTYLQAGLNEGNVIMSDGAATRHISGTTATLEEGYDESRPTAIQMSGMSASLTQAGAGIGVWAACGNIGPFWAHQAQTWRAADTSQQYRCYVRCGNTGAGQSSWRFRATGVPSTVTYPAAVLGATAWTVVDGLLIDSTATDTIYFETASAAGETITVTDLTVKRYTP